MQLPKRKIGEYSQIPQDPYLTKSQIKAFEDELSYLKKVKHPRAVKEMQEFAEHGDFSENHAYQMAKRRVRGILGRITALENILKNAIEIEEGSGDGFVGIGSTVTVDVDGTEKTYTILGSQETDPSSGKISHLSPIGSALKGLKKGDEVDVEVGDVIRTYKILDVK